MWVKFGCRLWKSVPCTANLGICQSYDLNGCPTYIKAERKVSFGTLVWQPFKCFKLFRVKTSWFYRVVHFREICENLNFCIFSSKSSHETRATYYISFVCRCHVQTCSKRVRRTQRRSCIACKVFKKLKGCNFILYFKGELYFYVSGPQIFHKFYLKKQFLRGKIVH